jgi:iron complex outermembrane receptor protein
MNIILKKSTNGGSVTEDRWYTEGDGEMYGVSLNNGSEVERIHQLYR